MGAELGRLAPGVLELGAGVGGDEVAGLDPLEPVPLQKLCVLCLQQSTGDSAGPEIDVATTLLADRALDRHIGDLHPAAGALHA